MISKIPLMQGTARISHSHQGLRPLKGHIPGSHLHLMACTLLMSRYSWITRRVLLFKSIKKKFKG